jgi:F-type H+-transporting ATPase subunit b
VLPQLDSSFYISQLFWLAVCLAVLVIFLKRRVIPRVNSIISRRDTFMAKERSLVENAETEIARMEAEIERLREDRLRSVSAIMKGAIEKSDTTLRDQIGLMKAENDAIISETRRKLNDELKNLESTLKMQIDITTQIIFERLFFGSLP